MTKQELEEKIAKGESVWNLCKGKLTEIKTSEKDDFGYWDKNKKEQCFISSYDRCAYRFNELFATKAEAEHYLHHANITRVKTLPFLTWEEFKQGNWNWVRFKSPSVNDFDAKEYVLKIKQESILLIDLAMNESKYIWEATEENFYKAYDECVKLFKGKE